MRILIELPTWLGDAVMVTPAIENLVNYYKEPEVILIGSFISIEVLKHHPKISNTYVIRKKYTSLYKISKKLGQFDIFFSFRSSLRTKFFKLLISSKKKFQFDGDRYQNRHQVEKYNDFINDNLNTNFHPGRLIVHPSLKPKDNNSKPIVGINPGASYGDSKRWHPEKFAKVATELSNKFDILIFGSIDEKNITTDIEKLLIENNVSNYQKFQPITYEYLLDGYLSEWVSVNESPFIEFNNLKPGDYEFKVRARVGDLYSSNIDSISFSVERPWYFSNFMIANYFLVFAIIFFLFNRSYEKYYREKEEKIIRELKDIDSILLL